ncbi:GGDEF domain-containing protein [Pseudomonas sp. LS44]|uniref:GGDEF domain-containing protein n=1 Tax=Pseudomonas sp. LS44 TaxID=1357074 RepID=UPI00215AF226|nr:GGDEF domain-containing protein [Pseudomonas sp. LS44]UVE18819.1 GGDEF domain-containing protein [Pseudomonas sp. LS44]
MASTASLLHLLLCWLAFSAGFMSLHLAGMLVLSFIVLSSCVLFLLVIWLNLNLRFRDPSLTTAQMCWAIGVVFFTAYFVETLRMLFLMMALVVMMFGAFRLRLAGYVRVGLFTAACYVGLLVSLWARGAVMDGRVELIQAFEFAVLMLGVCILGLEMSNLRNMLQVRNRDLQQALERIQLLAITDELTGLYNRRFANDLLAQQKSLADRGNYSFVLCLVDLDLFKSVNDRFGHGNGDAVLKQLAQLFRHAVRDVDFVARLGGEEFLLLLSHTDVTGAELVLERLRQGVRNTEWQDCLGLRLSLSVGVSAYRPVEDWEDTMLRADGALYQAKNGGRDQVVVL